MHYTQDESYYMLDAGDDAVVYLGLKDDVGLVQMLTSSRPPRKASTRSTRNDTSTGFRPKKHDHFLIPAGTVHCSGRNSMVLEITATPYIFTFKMWDWGRLGLDGVPRPIHLDHARANVHWTDGLTGRGRTWSTGSNSWLRSRLARSAPGCTSWSSSRRAGTGSPARVAHDTVGNVNVLNLVEGEEAISKARPAPSRRSWCTTPRPSSSRPPSARIPSAPSGAAVGERLGTVKAYVRGTQHGSEPVTSG